MPRLLTFALLVALAGCGAATNQAAPENEAARIGNQIDRQARQIMEQAENGTVAIERALENEGAAIFDNRAELLNEAAPAETAAPPGAANQVR